MPNSIKKLVVAFASAGMILASFAPVAFAAAHPVGSFVKTSDGTVWMITPEGTRRPFTSGGAALSYGFFSWSQVMDASAEDAALPVGSFINPRDGGIFCATETKGSDVKGECSLVTGGMKAAFTSAQVFKDLGFSFSNAFYGDSSFLSKTSNVASGTEAHRAGVLVNNNGTVQLVGANGLLGIPDIATFNSWGFRFVDVVPANAADKAMSQTGVMAARQAGQLSPTATATTPVQTGPITAMLSANTPASSTLVAGQATADLAHFTFSGAGAVTNVTLQRIGVSADATPSNVYLFDGATRLTDAASVASNGIVTFNNASGLFTVSGSKTIAVKSDIASTVNATSTAGQTVGFKLATFTAAGGTAQTVNISGNIHSIAASTLASVSAGTVTPTGATINPAAGVTLWQSTLTISTRDVWMKRIALRNVGSAPASSFTNFKLFVNGTQVGTASSVDINGYVTFDFMSNPVMLASGSRIVRMDADVVSGASRTVQFSLRSPADVDFVDSSFGVNITPTSTPWAAASASTISGTSGGTLTIEKDITSPSTNLVNNGSDVKLAIFKVTAYGEPIKIETIRATYSSSDANIGSLRNGRILIGGTQYGSTATLNEDSQATPYTSYTVNYTVTPGTPVMLELRADIYDNDGTDSITAGTDTINGTIAAGSSNAQRMDSLGSFSAPSSAVSSNTLTIASTGITLTKNSTYANQSTSLPATNFKIGSWNLAGSSVEDVLLSTLSFDVDEVVSTEFDEGDITNMYVVVKNGSTTVASPSPLATVAAADNNFSINYTLPKNQSVSIELFANLSDDGSDSAIDAADSFKTDLTVTGTSLIGGTSVTATSADTDGQTIAYAVNTLTASVDANSPTIALVSDNQTLDSAAFKFEAATSGFNVTDITFTLPSAGATVAQNVMLYEGSTLIASMPGSTTVTFSGLNWNIPANTSKVLTVKLQLGTIGLGAGTTGAALTTTMTVFTAVSTSTGTSDASAADSGPSIESPANPAGAALVAHAAFPTISQGVVSTSLVNAIENDMYKFVVNPNGGPIALKQLKFTVVVNDNVGTNDTLTVGSFKLYRGSTDLTTSSVDIHNTAGATLESTNSLAEGTSTVIVTWSTEEQINASTEFTLKATPTGFSTAADDDYINTTLAYDSSAQTSGNTYLVDLDSTTAQVTVGLQDSANSTSDGTIGATVTTGPNVVWTDASALPHSSSVTDDADGTQDAVASSADWRNGYLIQSMPLAGISKNN